MSRTLHTGTPIRLTLRRSELAMTDAYLDYDTLVDRALRGVVRTSIAQVAEDGFTGDHHFYITFRTDHPGVEIPDHLRASHPGEMTIVLQFQYWGLEVSDEAFSVTLSFNRNHERLTVPFTSLTSFVDPSVKFGLQFTGAGQTDRPASGESPLLVGNGTQDGNATEPAPPPSGPSGPSGPSDKEAAAEVPDETAAGGEVVHLDTFRKRK
ncbi:MAG: ClpXP protease specificity-enhancing factor SspB [Alphaproteobacteria bacterium]